MAYIPGHTTVVYARDKGGVGSVVRQVCVHVTGAHARAVVDAVDQESLVAGHVIPAGGVKRKHHGLIGALFEGKEGLAIQNRLG
jgi:hypothetical protein